WYSAIWRLRACCGRFGWGTSTIWRTRRRCRSTATGGRVMTRNDETRETETAPSPLRSAVLAAVWAAGMDLVYLAAYYGHDWLPGAGALGLVLHMRAQYKKYPHARRVRLPWQPRREDG